MMKKILIIDDEPAIIQTIRTYFEDNSYLVLEAGNAEKAETMLGENPDIILLDIMMPGIDGITFCGRIREKVRCPILFLSAKTEETSKLKGFSAGGDDFITKPFSIRELYARVEAHVRRENRPRNETGRLQFQGFWIDVNRKEAGFDDGGISFTKKEYLIVELLFSNMGLTFTHEQIYDRVWGFEADGDPRTAVMEYLKRIRKKLRDASKSELIETVWGIGYRWKR